MQNSQLTFDSASNALVCRGAWDLKHLNVLTQQLETIPLITSKKISINGKNIERMDSAGAWLLAEWLQKCRNAQENIALEQFSPEHKTLLQLVQKELAEETPQALKPAENTLAVLGKAFTQQANELVSYLSFVGYVTLDALRIGLHPLRWRWAALANVIYRNGLLALPIIALLSFMIGVVITYQLGLQLKTYGANIYIVDLLGLAILREFGPLLTAIMVAGRTGSSFTAELGMMKLNQEIDALNTLGVTPAELLLLPRILGLLITLPLLTIWADIFGVMGGMMMANNMLSITWHDFIYRFPHVIPLRSLLIGLGKAPVFALLIASIGCFQGMQVQGGADSVGRNTTRSVVLAIFFIIVADALFSVIFSKLKL